MTCHCKIKQQQHRVSLSRDIITWSVIAEPAYTTWLCSCCRVHIVLTAGSVHRASIRCQLDTCRFQPLWSPPYLQLPVVLSAEIPNYIWPGCEVHVLTSSYFYYVGIHCQLGTCCFQHRWSLPVLAVQSVPLKSIQYTGARGFWHYKTD